VHKKFISGHTKHFFIHFFFSCVKYFILETGRAVCTNCHLSFHYASSTITLYLRYIKHKFMFFFYSFCCFFIHTYSFYFSSALFHEPDVTHRLFFHINFLSEQQQQQNKKKYQHTYNFMFQFTLIIEPV
jgi:hypothetical protein